MNGRGRYRNFGRKYKKEVELSKWIGLILLMIFVSDGI